MTENIVVSKAGFSSVTLHTISIKENWVNNIEQYNNFLTEKKYLRGYKKWILNFLNISRIIEVSGYISTEQGTVALTSRARLIKIMRCYDIIENASSPLCTIKTGDTYWYDEPDGVIGAMSGLEIRDVPADKHTPRFFLVTFSIIEGNSR